VHHHKEPFYIVSIKMARFLEILGFKKQLLTILPFMGWEPTFIALLLKLG